jgi:DNA replication protein DnaC
MNEGSGNLTRFYSERARWCGLQIPEPFRGIGLSDYRCGSLEHGKARAAAQDYVDDARCGVGRPLYIFGSQGSGKTMLASCVWNQLAPGLSDRALYEDAALAGTADNLAFVTGAQLVQRFRRQDEDLGVSCAQQRHHISTCWLAVIDDIDKFPCGEWGNALFDVVDSRVWRLRLPTIITSNLGPAELALRYGEAGQSITSRLVRAGGVFIRLDQPVAVTQEDR